MQREEAADGDGGEKAADGGWPASLAKPADQDGGAQEGEGALPAALAREQASPPRSLRS